MTEKIFEKCLICGSTDIVVYEDITITIGEDEEFQETVEHVNGYDCNTCEEGLFHGQSSDPYSSMARVSAAHDRVVLARRKVTVTRIKNIISRLNLSDSNAATIFSKGSDEKFLMLLNEEIPTPKDFSLKIKDIENMISEEEMLEALNKLHDGQWH